MAYRNSFNLCICIRIKHNNAIIPKMKVALIGFEFNF